MCAAAAIQAPIPSKPACNAPLIKLLRNPWHVGLYVQTRMQVEKCPESTKSFSFVIHLKIQHSIFLLNNQGNQIIFM